MFCSTCGAQLSDNAVFCSNCGAALVQQPSEDIVNSRSDVQSESQECDILPKHQTSSRSKGKKIFIIILVIVGLIILCTGIFLILEATGVTEVTGWFDSNTPEATEDDDKDADKDDDKSEGKNNNKDKAEDIKDADKDISYYDDGDDEYQYSDENYGSYYNGEDYTDYNNGGYGDTDYYNRYIENYDSDYYYDDEYYQGYNYDYGDDNYYYGDYNYYGEGYAGEYYQYDSTPDEDYTQSYYDGYGDGYYN